MGEYRKRFVSELELRGVYVSAAELEEECVGVITDRQRRALLDFQGGVCAICAAFPELVLDHNHASLLVRGFLCHTCNVRLGHYRDSPPLLASSGHWDHAAYIKNPPAKQCGIHATYPGNGITLASRSRAMWTAAVLESIGWGPDRRVAHLPKESRDALLGALTSPVGHVVGQSVEDRRAARQSHAASLFNQIDESGIGLYSTGTIATLLGVTAGTVKADLKTLRGEGRLNERINLRYDIHGRIYEDCGVSLPGRGALLDAEDPTRPATTGDKETLSATLAHVDGAAVRGHRSKRFGGRGNSGLTHSEAAEFQAWAVKEVLT